MTLDTNDSKETKPNGSGVSAERGGEFGATVKTGSVVWQTLRSGRRTVQDVWEAWRKALGSARESSIVEGWLDRVARFVSRAYASSRVARVRRWTVAIARESVLYEWLTTEPEPQVVQIDLRDTVTVGPLLAALYRVVAIVHDAVAGSTAWVALMSGARGFERAPVRWISVFVGAVVLVRTTLAMLLGTATRFDLVVGVLLLLLAAAGSRDDRSAMELRAGPMAHSIRNLVEPPDVQDGDRDTGSGGPHQPPEGDPTETSSLDDSGVTNDS